MSGVVGGTMGVEKGGEWSAKEAGQRKRGGTLVDVTGRAKRETKGGRVQNSRMGYWDRDEVGGGGSKQDDWVLGTRPRKGGGDDVETR